MLSLDPELRTAIRHTVVQTQRSFGRTAADPSEYVRPLIDTASLHEIASRLEYCKLSPTETASSINKACVAAKHHGFHSVCVHSCWAGEASQALQHSRPLVTAVVAFPFGMSSPAVKAFETAEAVRAGADEIDVVARTACLDEPAGLFRLYDELETIVGAADGRPVKAIIEMGLINGLQRKVQAACVSEMAGVALVKTSSGFVPDPSKSFVRGPLGATEADIQIVAAATTSHTGIKAAGGIRNRQRTVSMLSAGATRVGTSYAPLIVA